VDGAGRREEGIAAPFFELVFRAGIVFLAAGGDFEGLLQAGCDGLGAGVLEMDDQLGGARGFLGHIGLEWQSDGQCLQRGAFAALQSLRCFIRDGNQISHIWVESGETSVERCEMFTTLAGKLGQPSIGDLPVAGQSAMADFIVAEAVQPELMALHLPQLPECGPGRSGGSVGGRHHVQPQERAFRHGAGGKAKWLHVKPGHRASMVHMRTDRECSEQVAIQKLDHSGIKNQTSSWRRATSSLVMGFAP
jgi:hypothetical protein